MTDLAVNTIFLVEDSPAIREALMQRLEDDSRFTVTGYAETAKDAIAALKQRLPDIVVIDLHLKQGTGYDILMYLRTIHLPVQLQAIVLTNYASPAHRRRAIELGATGFFDKSMELEEMLEGLGAWANKKDLKNPAVPPS